MSSFDIVVAQAQAAVQLDPLTDELGRELLALAGVGWGRSVHEATVRRLAEAGSAIGFI